MSKSLVTIQSSPDYISTLKWQCGVLKDAGDMIPEHWNSAAAVVAAMMLADELGIGRITALRGMYSVQGKVSCGSQLMLAMCLPHLDIWQVKGDDESCTATARRKGMEGDPTSITFTMADAKKMGLAGKSNYLRQPDVMLRWRAIAGVLRIVMADRLEGIYTHDELERPTVVTDDGNLELDNSMVVEQQESGPLDGKQQAEAVLKPKEEESVAPDPTPEAEKPEEKKAKKPTKKPEKPKSVAQEINDKLKVWLPPLEWHEWVSAALGALGNKEYKQRSLEALNLPKNRTAQIWGAQILKMNEALQAAGQKSPPMPAGVLTEGLQS